MTEDGDGGVLQAAAHRLRGAAPLVLHRRAHHAARARQALQDRAVGGGPGARGGGGIRRPGCADDRLHGRHCARAAAVAAAVAAGGGGVLGRGGPCAGQQLSVDSGRCGRGLVERGRDAAKRLLDQLLGVLRSGKVGGVG